MVVNLSGRGDKDLDSVAQAPRGQAVMRLYAWWNGMNRQKRTGWTLIVVVGRLSRVFPEGAAVRGRAGDQPQGMV